MMATLVAVLVCVLVQPSLQYNRRSVCPCSVLTSSDMYSSLEEFIETTSTKYYQLNCCKSFVNTTNQSDININWWYKGVRFPWGRVVSSFRLGYCGRGSRESLESDGVLLEDEGQFLCSLSSASSGLVLLNKTFNLCVNRNDELRGPPIKSVSTGDSWALLGEEVTFQCSAFVGRQACGKDSATTLRENLKWIKETQPGVWVDANRLTNTNITVLKEEKGTVRSELSVSEVQRTHYGRYRCTITNRQGSVHHTLTLKQGVPPSERVALGYRTAIVVMVAAALCFTITTVVWHRCRLAFAFYFRGRVTKGIKTDDGQVDVLVVHGDSATYWVGSVLLPVLEDTYHYKCFLPQRDMLAGDLILEEVATRVWRCNSVLVVVTPCLLQCSWAAWALHHALQASLTTNIRLISLKLQNFKPNDPCLSDPYDIVKSLKPVRSLRVPKSCGLQMLVVKEETPDDDTTNSLPGQNGRKRERDTESLAGRNTSLPDENKRGEDKNVNSKGSWWGNKEKRVKATSKIDKKKEIRDISQERDKAEHWKLERQERRSRLEVPSSSSSKIRSRSRSRSKSPMECTWRLIEEEQIQEENIFTSDLGKMSRVKQDKIQRTTNEIQYNNNNTTPDAVESPRTQLKLNLSELIQPHYMSGSPGSQRLSNMVSASRAASRESLEPDENTTAIEKHRHLTQEYQDDLDSPSSITRFILTPPQHPSPSWRTRSICESLSLVFTSDAELVFWHTLLYRLGPPSTTPLQV
ncbi:hypothetical protein Pmani_009153 [Petrolisthes manimaculis]|uniref:Soluble interferon alpha/beta receptor OPG204 n=1 Tax=Petrolisthes manimaculis TaxID=1843537 RepID=A0AAE1Q4W0_9EUCA|nr:hypothetical protein Pmani_009153 [Petrolisthes manimaculis]